MNLKPAQNFLNLIKTFNLERHIYEPIFSCWHVHLLAHINFLKID